ncbi:GIY-YIG nuclease family protein [Metabacillus herbersteinensis]|uniref:GIY-YIG nuclease family protein n=1 Tax=Metabacillus herbersteinensis TaxID=283816 RepID=A0ABV6GKP8_9BACI
MEQLNHYFYVLECNDGSYYAGYSNNVDQRLKKHNEGKGAKYTRAKKPVELLYSKAYHTKSEALKMECYFKKLSRKNKEIYLTAEKEKEGECG